MVTVPSVSCQLWCPKVSKGRAGSPLVRPQAQDFFPAGGLTRRLRHGSRACSPMGRSHVSFVGERNVCKRKPAARRLQRRPAPLRVAGFGLREPNGWMPRIYSGHPIPALRPEQSDHVPWADCPQGLSSSTGCPVSHSSLPVALLASHPPCGSLWAAPKAPLGPRFPSGQFATLTRREKGFYCPFWRRGRNVARNEVGQLPPALGARSCSPFSAVKMDEPFSLRCLSPLCFAAGDAGQTQTAMLGMLRCDRDDSTARKNRLDFYSVVGINRTQIMSVWIFRHVLEFPETQKASGVSNPRWLFMRAMRPVAEWRSFLFN